MEAQLSLKHNKFLNNLEKFMKNKNVNDKCIQQDIGISVSTISKWRSRGSFPSVEVLFKMSEYFNVNINDFFEDSITYNNKPNVNSEGGNIIMKESCIDDPLNKFVEWRFVSEYPFTVKQIESIIYNFNVKNVEGYVFKDEYVDYYLICQYKKHSLEDDRSIYYFKYNDCIPPEEIIRDKDMVGQLFDYLHEKFIDEVKKDFYNKHKR